MLLELPDASEEELPDPEEPLVPLLDPPWLDPELILLVSELVPPCDPVLLVELFILPLGSELLS